MAPRACTGPAAADRAAGALGAAWQTVPVQQWSAQVRRAWVGWG